VVAEVDVGGDLLDGPGLDPGEGAEAERQAVGVVLGGLPRQRRSTKYDPTGGMIMSASPHEAPPPKEATLIRVARQAQGLSPEVAAGRTPIRLSGSRWRQIEAGFRKSPPGSVRAPDLTLAHMAHTVGVTAERLDEAGRSEAAAILREIQRQAAESERSDVYADLSDPHEAAIWQRDSMSEDDRRAMIDMVRKVRHEERRRRA
jgi:hypothetical protein